MVHWRRRLRFEDVPKAVRTGKRRRGQHVTQEAVARAANVGTRWYATLERGELDNGFGAELLDRVATVLRLGPDERRVLFLLANGTEPTPIAPSAPVSVSREIRAMLACHPWPAYITDEFWQMLCYNEATAIWFPHVKIGLNMMRWTFCDATARDVLLDWDKTHAPLMLAQLRATYARMPEASVLLELIAEILDHNPVARELWTSRPIVSLEEFTGPRRMCVAGASEPTTVTVVSMVPVATPEIRVTVVIPIGGHVPPPCAAHAPVITVA